MGIIEGFMLEAFGASDAGNVRANNEDCYLVRPDRGLYIVADGMGGAQAGEHASRMAVDVVSEVIDQADQSSALLLSQAFDEANRRVLAAAANDPLLQGMGTTLIAALEHGNELLIASVGDSRAYLYEDQELRVITDDQTWVNEVGRKLGIDDEGLRIHPMRHVLTMAIGVSPQLRTHTYTLEPRTGSQILLCSDGLHGVVHREVIADVLSGPHTLETKCRFLLEEAKRAGAPDNVTAVLLQANGLG